MVRFVIDESSWNLQGVPTDRVEEALGSLLERLETARDRDEEARLYTGFYEFDDVSPKPWELLFGDTGIIVDRDLRTRVELALDRLDVWTNEPALEVEIDGASLLAPSIAYAHYNVGSRHAVACLPLCTAGRVGPVEVVADGRAESVHFVTEEPEHRAFFREAIQIDNADDKTFPTLATSAFPDLHWADGVWRGLRKFSRPFHEVRGEITRHLGVFDDHGATICSERNRAEWTAHFGTHGVTATGENGNTMANAKARVDRIRTWNGAEHVFWWHAKLLPDRDRIHFIYDGDHACIVVGIFTDHCYLP